MARRWWLGAVPPAVVLLLLVPPFVFEARLAMPLRGIRGGVPFALPAALLFVGVAVAFGLAVGLRRSLPRWRLLGIALCGVPLLLALPLAGPPTGLQAEIERVGLAGTMQLWALLTAAALFAGLAMALAARQVVRWRQERTRGLRPIRALVAAALGGAFVVLILRTSTGVDFLSSSARWGAIGVAMGASVLAALSPDDDSEPAVHALLFACIGVSLLAQREYVAALAADTLAHADPFLDPAAYEHSLREIASAVEPRERHGWLLALLPFLLLGRWLREPRRAAVPIALTVALLAGGLGISAELDRQAVQTAERFTADHAAAAEPSILEWSRRAIPRSAPWVRALRPEPEPEIRCAAWSAP